MLTPEFVLRVVFFKGSNLHSNIYDGDEERSKNLKEGAHETWKHCFRLRCLISRCRVTFDFSVSE